MHELPDGLHLDLLIDAAQVTADADRVLSHAVTAARHAGATWTQIGDAVGITHNAAKRRWRSHQRNLHSEPQKRLPEF
jgi:hypothetical protein